MSIFQNCIFYKKEAVKKKSDSLNSSPSYGRADWTETTVTDFEQNPSVGMVITVILKIYTSPYRQTSLNFWSQMCLSPFPVDHRS